LLAAPNIVRDKLSSFAGIGIDADSTVICSYRTAGPDRRAFARARIRVTPWPEPSNGKIAMTGKYDHLTQAQLIELLEKRDRSKKLGLVWERDEIAADAAVDANFIACEIVPDLSDKASPWANMVIEGDNFDALRWLRMTHSGAVKCIYIDPPYNTGSVSWVYNDNYIDKDDRYRQSTWLEFLYRRLILARDLLAEDGVLLVSINDEQRAKLELLMDEALPGMRLGCFVWRTRKGGYDSGNFSKDHDFVLIYRKPKFEFGGSSKKRTDYSNPDNDPRGPWTDDPLQQPKNFKLRKAGVYLIEDPEHRCLLPPEPQSRLVRWQTW
jgi:adenine-specific DNA-methyltransferase